MKWKTWLLALTLTIGGIWAYGAWEDAQWEKKTHEKYGPGTKDWAELQAMTSTVTE